MNDKLKDNIFNILVELRDIGFHVDIFDIGIDELDIYVYNKVHWWENVSDYIITLTDYLELNNIGMCKIFTQHNSHNEINLRSHKNELISQTYIKLRK